MGSPADDIPDLERLLRNVARLAMEVEHGTGWLGGLSSAQSEAVRRAGDTARRKRPEETLRDDWEAVGLDEIRSVLRSSWPEALSPVWPDNKGADVDLARLSAYRGKNLHAVGPPGSEMSDVEVGAILHRLRVGLEAVRRGLHDHVGEWWPYMAAVHSNIPEFCWERSSGQAFSQPPGVQAVLNEGDLVEITIIGEHPRAHRDRLRYQFVDYDGELNQAWSTNNRVRFVVPGVRDLGVHAYVTDVADTDGKSLNHEHMYFMIQVRPADLT